MVGRQEFAGYWEYVLDDAIFTAPAHPFWGGSGLIGSDGKLMGIGSLILQQGDGKGRRLDMNMVVPIGLLTPIMQDLLSYGRVNRPARPWLGMYATESDDDIVVGGLADNGPADQAGVRAGDRILAVGGDEITDLAGLWRRVWASGSAGAEVRLRLMRDKSPVALTVRSGDRTSFPEVAEAALMAGTARPAPNHRNGAAGRSSRSRRSSRTAPSCGMTAASGRSSWTRAATSTASSPPSTRPACRSSASG